VQTTVNSRIGGDYLARASHYTRQREAFGEHTFPAMFAARVKACYERAGVTGTDLGFLAEKAYRNANKNPKAHMHAVTMELATACGEGGEGNPCFLEIAELAPFMRLSDCSQVSDGGAAMVVVSEAGLKAIGRTEADAIEVCGYGHSTASLYDDANPIALDTMASAAAKAYAATGRTACEMGVAEVHDCFTISELLSVEALGFGDGRALARDGSLEIGGRIPTNTGGGLVGFGHPVGATGVKQVLEIYHQMKGLAGDYQITTLPSYGITANMGGDDRTAVVSIFKNT